jgi:two-component system sensor histidine kinase KdpD
MVGAHGGSVEALAGPGNRGACMRITLPMAEPAKAAS